MKSRYVVKRAKYGAFEENLLFYLRFNHFKTHNMREIAPNVPQFGDFDKCSSGSRILRSQFFPGLTKELLHSPARLFIGIY